MDPFCNCHYTLNFDEELELDRLIKRQIKLHKNTKRIILLCHVRETKIGFNKVGLPIQQGFNVFCFCTVRKNYKFSIKITPPALCTLYEIQCNLEDTQAFSVKTFNHPYTCPDSGLSSLKDLALLNLCMGGLNRAALENLERQGKIPLWVRKSLPNFYYKHGLMNWCDFLTLYLPFPLFYAEPCKYPHEHMKIFE